MRIIVIGSGGREHAIVWKLKRDSPEDEVFAMPGNGGISNEAEVLSVASDSLNEIAKIAALKKADLTIVGPEVPLSLGITDLFLEKGMKVFGPIRKGAQLESSKSFSKAFMKRNNIPTANFSIAENFEESMKIIEKREFPCVVKYDGLAAGKGVMICEKREQAESFLKEIYVDRLFGCVSQEVIIEDCLFGTEVSYLIFTDTKTFLPMVSAKDHKRVFDGDKGLNTGGMGSYSPSDVLTPEIEGIIHEKIVAPTLKGLENENIDYRGVLYFGLMLTKNGPYLLEYNVRFGDPETQVILPRMDSSLVEIAQAVAESSLAKVEVKWNEKNAVCVMLASGGYPGKYQIDKDIIGIVEAEKEDVLLFHAGTKREGNRILTSGGRVLGVTALGATLKLAAEKAYQGLEKIDFEGKHYRKDIGLKY